MCRTYECNYINGQAVFNNQNNEEQILSLQSVDELIGRRNLSKISTATKIAGALYEKYNLDEYIREAGGNPYDTPIVISNRYANWDYVSQDVFSDISMTIESTNNYVATAWFPATIQGYLTIKYGNKGQAITLSTTDSEMMVSSIESMFNKDESGMKTGTLIYGTYESIPERIAGNKVTNIEPRTFGITSVFTHNDCVETIRDTVEAHMVKYNNVTK